MENKYFDIEGNMKVFVIFNGTEYVFDNDVNLAGYLERTCESMKDTDKDNCIFYGDETGNDDAPEIQ